MDDKLIVSNRGALTAKYGSAGLARIKKAVDTLVAADAKRGIVSRLLWLDDAAAMRRYRGKAVRDAADARQNKDAIDAIFKAVDPEYLLILGSVDVVPHQDVKNPAFDPKEKDDDPDEFADGDLPYACDAAYSRDIADFKGPTRVVGRLPDLTGASEPSYLLSLLSTAAKHRSRDVTDYAAYFGLSTKTWRKSTALSLFNTFGNADALVTAPPAGPRHPAKQLAALAHFINCHGGPNDPEFFGEDKDLNQPPSLSSRSIKGRIKDGTVAAVECCYGAQLYDSVTLALPLPICQHYLLQGAYGWFGSSTIAYGPADANGAADLITQYFLLALLDGASLGRAALVARQRFVQQVAELDPVDLKTLGQFNLLGDPSIHPAKVPSATAVPRGMDAQAVARMARVQRRAKLKASGDFLRDTKPTASRKSTAPVRSATVKKALANIARKAGIAPGRAFTAYDVKAPAQSRSSRRGGGAKAAPSGVASRYHLAVYRPTRNKGSARSVLAIAKEVGGRIVAYRIYTEK